MRTTIMSVFALLVSYFLLSVGHGLQNTLLGVRATLESYPDWIIWAMNSFYFIGFIVGTWVCTHLVTTVGHVRSFAAFATTASSLVLLHQIFVTEGTWILFRFFYGACIAALIMVIESWLNTLATRKNRGKILSLYMVLSFLGLAMGQVLMYLGSPSEFLLYALVSIIISQSFVPLIISKRIAQPIEIHTEHFGLKEMYKISPTATIGCIMTGFMVSSFWGMGAVYFFQVGFNSSDVGLLIACSIIGGLILQWPVGILSDTFDRRRVIVGVLILLVVSSVGLTLSSNDERSVTWTIILATMGFGGSVYTLYSQFVALANDFLETKHIIKASGTLLSLQAIGSIFGPIVVAVGMSVYGPSALFLITEITAVMLATFIFIRMFVREIPEDTSVDTTYVPVPRTSAATLTELYSSELESGHH